MAFQPPIELTWRNLFKASFLAIGDAALIAMIKDAPVSLQFAMVLASIIGFAALVKEEWLHSQHRYAFQTVLGISGAIFSVFVAFAIGRLTLNYNNASPELNVEINSLDSSNKNLQEIIDGRARSK